MKKGLSWLLAVLLLVNVVGVTALAAEEEEDGIPGSYTLIGMDDGTDTDYSEYLPLLDSMGMSITLEISEDGFGVMKMMDETMEMQFDFDAQQVIANGNAMPYQFEDGELSFGADDTYFLFSKKGAPKPEKEPFDYYLFEDIVDSDGEKQAVTDETIPELYLFESGDAVAKTEDGDFSLHFDFEEMTVTMAGYPETVPFTVEDGLLSMGFEDDYRIRLRLSDPGFVGPYVMTEFIGLEETDSEELELMMSVVSMFSLVIDEEGDAVLSMVGVEIPMHFDFDTMIVTTVDEESGEEEEMPFTYENGTLRMEEDGVSMTLRRVLEPASESEQTTEEEPAEAGAKK